MTTHPVRILLVEDDEIDREALLRFMRHRGAEYLLHAASSEAEALQVLRMEVIDVLILDYHLGATTGFSLIPHVGDVPIIIVTGHGSEAIAVEAMRLGAADYLIKDSEHHYLEILPHTIQTVLERFRNRRELEQARFLLNDIIHSMPSMLVGVDDSGNVTRWNREAEKNTGLSVELALGQPLENVCPPLASQMKHVQAAIITRQIFQDELSITREDGDARLWNVSIYPLSEGGTGGAVIRIDDVTEQVRTQAMTLQTEKMLSISGLAAGMAHELNNPLAGMLHNLQVIRNRITSGLIQNARVAEYCGLTMEAIEDYMTRRGIYPMMDSIKDAGHRAAAIIDNLLMLSCSGEKRSSAHDLSLLLDKAVDLACGDSELINKYFFQSIEIGKEYHSPLPPVMCEPDKIQKVFFNLLKNGAQAMAEYRTQNNINKRFRFMLRIYPKDSFIHVEIEDNGPGINEQMQKRIFEPFFTTQRVGEGTGLGLSVSFSIITRDHGGTIEVKSAPGKGTLFLVRLPLDRRAR